MRGLTRPEALELFARADAAQAVIARFAFDFDLTVEPAPPPRMVEFYDELCRQGPEAVAAFRHDSERLAAANALYTLRSLGEPRGAGTAVRGRAAGLVPWDAGAA